MMFIAGAIEYLGKRFGYSTAYLNIKEHLKFLKSGYYSFNNPVDDFPKLFKNFNWNIDGNNDVEIKQIIRTTYHYQHIYELDDHTELIGYFQSEQFWGGDRDFIKWLFEPSEFVLEQLKPYESMFTGTPCAVHIRRGDYLKFPHVYATMDGDYVLRAKKELKDKKITHYVVFSDDMEWCKQTFRSKEFVFPDIKKDYLGMFMIGMCPHKIVANSAYSWFGAYLSDNGGEVVAPKEWVKDPKIDDSNVCPWYWIRV